MKLQVKMVLDRTTPGTYLYRECDANGIIIDQRSGQMTAIGNIYVRKSAVPHGEIPTDITVTVEG